MSTPAITTPIKSMLDGIPGVRKDWVEDFREDAREDWRADWVAAPVPPEEPVAPEAPTAPEEPTPDPV